MCIVPLELIKLLGLFLLAHIHGGSVPDLSYENKAYSEGFKVVAGIDEVGRGCLAGPVLACAVVMPKGLIIDGVADSKKMSAKKREIIATEIRKHALAIGYGVVSSQTIDLVNILNATFMAMRQAVGGLNSYKPDLILVDGNQIIPSLSVLKQETIVGGDNVSHSIASASILAKVARDAMMTIMDNEYPGYGLSGHKGYGTAVHLDAIKQLGPSLIHRLTFGGVKEYVKKGVILC